MDQKNLRDYTMLDAEGNMQAEWRADKRRLRVWPNPTCRELHITYNEVPDLATATTLCRIRWADMAADPEIVPRLACSLAEYYPKLLTKPKRFVRLIDRIVRRARKEMIGSVGVEEGTWVGIAPKTSSEESMDEFPSDAESGLGKYVSQLFQELADGQNRRRRRR